MVNENKQINKIKLLKKSTNNSRQFVNVLKTDAAYRSFERKSLKDPQTFRKFFIETVMGNYETERIRHKNGRYRFFLRPCITTISKRVPRLN